MPDLSTSLIQLTESGLYCPLGGFYIDPLLPVDRAVITHAHSDHARRGSRTYYCESSGVDLLKCRLGQSIEVHSFPYSTPFQLGQVRLSFHSAGHILGSSQIRIESHSEVWVVTGDFKREADPSCQPFELVPCDTLITEATFGTPRYRWNQKIDHGAMIWSWWQSNRSQQISSLLFGYSLGKAQRILAELFPWADEPIWIYPSMGELTECYRKQGVNLPVTRILNEKTVGELKPGALILAPPSVLKAPWIHRLGKVQTAFASGWMKTRPTQGFLNQDGSYSEGGLNLSQSPMKPTQEWRFSYHHGFVMSDHADWDDLNQTIQQTGARQVYVLHRNHGALVKHLRALGIQAHPISALSVSSQRRRSQLNTNSKVQKASSRKKSSQSTQSLEPSPDHQQLSFHFESVPDGGSPE